MSTFPAPDFSRDAVGLANKTLKKSLTESDSSLPIFIGML